MRTPVEVWLKEHKKAYVLADELVELLAPDDIQARLVHPEESKLRATLAEHLNAIVEFTGSHFRGEEKILVPVIQKYLNTDDPKIREAMGCLSREHAQMHMFMERITQILPSLESGEPLNDAQTAEILRVSYSVQSIIRHHCTKEEREIYPLIGRLPMEAVVELMNALDPSDDINLDHLVKPLGEGGSPDLTGSDPGEGPEN